MDRLPPGQAAGTSDEPCHEGERHDAIDAAHRDPHDQPGEPLVVSSGSRPQAAPRNAITGYQTFGAKVRRIPRNPVCRK
jgi:hypothetical protein